MNIDNCDEIQKKIARDLSDGRLILMLGAGVSMGFNLPSWENLLKNILNTSETANDNSSLGLDELSVQIDDLEHDLKNDYGRYIEIVHNALYSELKDTSLTSSFLTNAPLLLALGAMCVGSVRGRVNHVITLNYDDILEQYLSMLGLKVNSGFDFKRPNFNSDVRIDHIHGYLPQKIDRKMMIPDNKIILSDASYAEVDNIITPDLSHWLHNITLGYKFFLVGLSGRDNHIKRFLLGVNTKQPLKANEDSGYWILTENAYDEFHVGLSRLGFIVIKKAKEDIPEYILKACALAGSQNL